ncbi:amino acid adenylation domain-containing protein [Rhodoferax sp. OV413]|uniref:non-ribosomal peptide synthetase n=1 Tax=Rhodoferax sp. OV413 TaxID=1855285 RepID=UPI000887A22E|nr:non-ribosomal peptide synthetase [Rhodoferax sp. OV413]SDO97684.1 amino acid adenylation domain-containing protein [Rhodoferax sp. OV413]
MNAMNMMADSIEVTFPLSPEQRTVLAGAKRLLLLTGIEGALDAARLHVAVESVLSAHGALRVAVCQVPGYRGLRQQYFDEMPPLKWQMADLSESADEALHTWVEDFNAEPLAMERGELVSAGLVRTGEGRHTLALSVNSLVADRESLHNLFDQIVAAYQGEGCLDPESIFQYTRFVEWRQDLLDGEDAAGGRAYWLRIAADAVAIAPLRLQGRLDGAQERATRHRISVAIDAAFADRVVARANVLGVQPETLLHAAWWLLLARLNGMDRFIGGWQHDCRRDYEPMQGAVGLFDKVLPVMVDVAVDESFASWLGRLDAALTAHIDVQEYWAVDAPPFSTHTVVGFASHEVPRPHGTDSQWRLIGLPGPMPCFELALQTAWQAEGVELALYADIARYSHAAVERLLLQFVTLLEAVVAHPDAPVGTLSLVGPKERELLLVPNDPRIDVGTQTVADRITHWAEATPDAPALQAGEQRLTYRELDNRINGLTHWLTKQGVMPGAIVALNLPRSLDLPVAMFATWRAGAAYLPLEPEWPEARRAAVLADAQPVLVLDAAALPALDDTLDAVPKHRIALQDLAYVLYTSGSTGKPKGVAIEQGHLLNYIAAASAAMKFDACRRWALTSSVVADLGNTALFGAFFNGACLVVAAEDEVKDAQAFARFMGKNEIDAIKIVPSHLEALLECESPHLPRTLVLGGEAAPRALVERISRIAPQCAIYNHYGPTETTVGVMVHAVSAGAPLPEQLPLSQVLANNRVHVLDASLRLVPAGGLGEVYVGGAQLCRGYLNREPGDAFVADPFNPGERLYRTGDLAYVRADGGIRLTGRVDHQVKILGFRVEPAEVEAVLLAQPGVRQAVVLAVPDAAGAMTLSAFVVADVALADGRELREWLAALLPSHMVPGSFTAVDAFARLPNGKIDRLALAAIVPSTAVGKDRIEPRDALEAVLADSMASLLGSGPIGIDDDFFELGGHSLQVIKLVARIRKLLQIELPAGVVFDHPTPAGLAAALREGRDDVAQLEARAQAYRQPEDVSETV